MSVTTGELVATDPAVTAPLSDWRSVTELTISPSGTVVRDGKAGNAAGKAWQGPREIRNLRWEGGGEQGRAAQSATLSPDDFQRGFNDAIEKSLEQEARDRAR